MMPVLFSVGPLVLYSGSVFLILSWLVASFTFWRTLKDEAVGEEKIFDCMFYMTIVGFAAARLGYVLLHWPDFQVNVVKIFALWVAPGLWFYSGLAGMFAVALMLSKQSKVRFSYIIDALAAAIAVSGIVASLGMLLEGSEVGKVTTMPLSVLFVGHPGLRHPYGLFTAIVFIILSVLFILMQRIALKRHLPYGTTGILFFLFLSIGLFSLEFLKDSPVYFRALTVNQWVLIALCTQALGALSVRLHFWSRVKPHVVKFTHPVKKYYDTISKRPSKGH